MKDKSLYQQLKSAKEEERVAESKKNKVELAMIREIAKAEKVIRAKYSSELERLKKDYQEKWGKTDDIGTDYHDFGEFSWVDMSIILATLMCYVEGEKWYSTWTEGAVFIIKEEGAARYDEEELYSYSDNFSRVIGELYRDSNLIVCNSCYSSIELYDCHENPNYKFGRFNYLREFVNRLIQYRIDNNIKNYKNLTFDKLYKFMCRFILERPELSLRNKEKREQILTEQWEDNQTLEECKRLDMDIKNKTIVS